MDEFTSRASPVLGTLHGETIMHNDRLHPHFGQGKRIVPWLDFGAEW